MSVILSAVFCAKVGKRSGAEKMKMVYNEV